MHLTLGLYFRIHTRTLSSTTLGHSAPDPCVCPVCANTSLCSDTRLSYLRTFKLQTRAPDSCSLKDEHSKIHDPSSGSASSSSYSHCSSSSRTTTVHIQKFEYSFLKISLKPFRYYPKASRSFKFTPFRFQITVPIFSQSSNPPALNTTRIATQENQISTLQISDADVAVLMVVGPRPKKREK